MKNKKGFTLIELLGVLILIGILLILAVPAVMKYMKKGTKAYYYSLEKELKSAGADYVETYRSLLPQNIGHVTVIELDELVDNKYIDKVVDEKGNECTGKVTIEKIKTDSYKYHSCLICGEYYSSDEKECSYNEYEINTYEDSGDYEIRVPQDRYTVNQGENFVAPYGTVYYKGEEIKNDLKGSPSKLDTKKLGEYEIIYFYHGAKKSIYVTVIDNVAPAKSQIVLKYDGKNGKSYKGNWYSGNIYVNYKATDYSDKGIMGSGIDYYEVSDDGVNFHRLEDDNQNNYQKLSETEQLIKVQGNYVRYVRAVDKNGNVGEVNSYRIKIDKTKPTCQLEVKSGTKYGDWYNTNITIGYKTKDGTVSDIVSEPIDTKSITSPIKNKKITGTVTDQAGNVGTCSITVSVDNKKPSNPTIAASDSIASNKWHKANFTLKYSGASNLSGNLYYYRVNAANEVVNGRGNGTNATSTSISTEANATTYYVMVCSGAGLCSGNSSYIVKLDKTKPICSFSGESTSWLNTSNASRTITATCDDQGKSGCTTATASKTWTISDSVKTKALSYTITDNAGNSSTCSKTANIYIDKIKPTCSFSGESTSWTNASNASRTITATCADTVSGCTTATASKTWTITESTKTKALSYTITDNAGNSETCSKTANIYIDKVKPTCSFSGESTSWLNASNASRTITATCADTVSGCTTATASKTWTITESTKTKALSYTITDNAGNSETCSKTANIYIDKVKPTISAKQSSLGLGTADYDFKSNVNTSCGVSGCNTTCNPATSKKTGSYNVTCTITSNAGLSSSVTFAVKHSYQCTESNGCLSSTEKICLQKHYESYDEDDHGPCSLFDCWTSSYYHDDLCHLKCACGYDSGGNGPNGGHGHSNTWHQHSVCDEDGCPSDYVMLGDACYRMSCVSGSTPNYNTFNCEYGASAGSNSSSSSCVDSCPGNYWYDNSNALHKCWDMNGDYRNEGYQCTGSFWCDNSGQCYCQSASYPPMQKCS